MWIPASGSSQESFVPSGANGSDGGRGTALPPTRNDGTCNTKTNKLYRVFVAKAGFAMQAEFGYLFRFEQALAAALGPSARGIRSPKELLPRVAAGLAIACIRQRSATDGVRGSSPVLTLPEAQPIRQLIACRLESAGTATMARLSGFDAFVADAISRLKRYRLGPMRTHRQRRRAEGAASRVAAILRAYDHSTYRLFAEVGQKVSAPDPAPACPLDRNDRSSLWLSQLQRAFYRCQYASAVCAQPDSFQALSPKMMITSDAAQAV